VRALTPSGKRKGSYFEQPSLTAEFRWLRLSPGPKLPWQRR